MPTYIHKTTTTVKLRRLYYILTLCVCIGIAAPRQAMAQQRTEKIEKYTVQPGETILGIAHRMALRSTIYSVLIRAYSPTMCSRGK